MIYSKGEVIDYIWQYSRYYGNLLISCEELSKERNLNGHVSLIYLFNILENIIKSQIHDYDASFVKVEWPQKSRQKLIQLIKITI